MENYCFGINYIQINDANIGSLITDIETPAFGYPKKLILIKNSGVLKKETGKGANKELQKNIASYIEKNINQINESVILVFIEEEIGKNVLVSTIEKNGVVCNFERLKPADIIKRLKAICNMYKVNVDDKTLMYLIEVAGTNMQNLMNEIRKLIEYAGENGTITKDSIEKLTIKELEARIFDLTDNLGKKDTAKALENLKELIYNKEPLQRILITLYNHFKKLYLTKVCMESNKDVLKVLNLKPNQTFLVSKYKNQVGYFKQKELRRILKELTELDKNSKSGNIDLNVGLEAIICACL